MAKTTHTPGPWRVRENPNGTLGIDAQERDGTDCQPARVNGDATDPVYGPETRANAALIAAAPDMFAALKSILKSEHIGGTIGAVDYRIDNAALEAARVAIAKAEGEVRTAKGATA